MPFLSPGGGKLRVSQLLHQEGKRCAQHLVVDDAAGFDGRPPPPASRLGPLPRAGVQSASSHELRFQDTGMRMQLPRLQNLRYQCMSSMYLGGIPGAERVP